MRVFQMHISRSSSSSSKSTYARYLCESVDCVSVLFALSTLFISIIHIIFHSFAIAVCDGVDDTLQSLCVRASERLHVISQSWKFCFIIYLFSWIKLSLDMWVDKKKFIFDREWVVMLLLLLLALPFCPFTWITTQIYVDFFFHIFLRGAIQCERQLCVVFEHLHI